MFTSIAPQLLFWTAVLAFPPEQRPLTSTEQIPLNNGRLAATAEAPRKLQGRFLHITDVHPDPFYETAASPHTSHACHSGSGSAGHYGAEGTDCDSPLTLVNATFEWIKQNLKDQVDFVVWTGDSARHDNDEDIPRTEKQVIKLNELVVEKFVEVFGKADNLDDPDPTNDFVIPIVPTFGNNDILPHNIFKQGPNRWTKRYSSVWRKFVPEAQRHSFERGGWFYTEVIPNRLAVFSLNTLYFFENNAAVDGCNQKSEPGYEHMEWLRIQLQLLRDRGMKAILIGHVPPARTSGKQSWYESCWQKYTLWVKQYRDVIAGTIYGHMNIDHFMIQDTENLERYYIEGEEMEKMDRVEALSSNGDPTFTIQGSTEYLNDLRDEWADLPSPPSRFSSASKGDDGNLEFDQKRKKERQKYLDEIGGEWAQRYSVSVVSPSVVPNYYPAIRVVEYNISGLEDTFASLASSSALIESTPDIGSELDDRDVDDVGIEKKKKGKKGKKGKKKPNFTVPKGPSKSSPPGPAHSPQTFSFLSYTQYFANLTYINNRKDEQSAGFIDAAENTKPKKFEFEVEYDTRNDTIYKMEDMTVRSYLDLAMRIGERKGSKSSVIANAIYDERTDQIDDADDAVESTKHKKKGKKHKKKKGKKGSKRQNEVWMTFVERAYVGAKSEEEIDEGFG